MLRLLTSAGASHGQHGVPDGAGRLARRVRDPQVPARPAEDAHRPPRGVVARPLPRGRGVWAAGVPSAGVAAPVVATAVSSAWGAGVSSSVPGAVATGEGATGAVGVSGVWVAAPQPARGTASAIPTTTHISRLKGLRLRGLGLPAAGAH